MIIDFRKHPDQHDPLQIENIKIEQVESIKFLGLHIANFLKWTDNTKAIIWKAHQCLQFLRKLKRCGVNRSAQITFYRAMIESILTKNIAIWFGSITQQQKPLSKRLFNSFFPRSSMTCIKTIGLRPRVFIWS
ncbi:hypothetical protein XELAEV_18041345mg [Xenopus laevis]|uniref:Alkylated DNA repair protein AlkB homologue 8 N-terminal domain-containing protein n=1 Tax=Xenopus laevis TaxID=8355 RepID=A0A974H4Z2_XENLA|nr:hypothetical protein XELAEV_18041345mg [Xenopus laevis]